MRWVIGIIVSVLLLWWSFHGIDLYPLAKIFASMPIWPLCIMLISIAAFFLLKALRWRLLLKPIKEIPSMELMPSIIIGTAINYILFGYMGEIVRMWLLSRQQNLRKGTIMMTIVVERILDLWTLLLFLAAATLISPQLYAIVAEAGYIALVLALIATLFIIFPQWLLKLFKIHHRLHKEIDLAMHGLMSIRHPKLLLSIALVSILQWLVMMAGCNWMAATAAGIELPPWALLGPMGLMIVGMALPSSPGQLGVIEMAYILGLQVWGVAKEQALAAGLLFHLILYLSVIIVALYLIHRLHLWSELRNVMGRKKTDKSESESNL